MPPRLKKLAYANVVVGPLVAIVNLVVIGRSISRLARLGASNGILIPLGCIALLFSLLGALLCLGGVGLLKERRWGRTWSLVFAFGSFGAVFLAGISARVMSNLAEIGAVSVPGLHQREDFSLGIGFFSLYAVLVIVMLMLDDARAWASGTGLAGTAANGTIISKPSRPTCGLAIASFVSSFIPFLFLGQVTGLILGIIALKKIRKSQGTLGGRGFAIAGITISSIILFFIIALLVLLLTNALNK